MSSLILDVVKLNESMDYTIIIPIIIGYFFLFWLMVSGWVAYDSYKRFKSKLKATVFFTLNMIFGLPFTILYIVVRPIDVDEEFVDNNESYGGVNVPVVNFVGKDGVVMALELKINSNKLSDEKSPEMKIDVSFDSQKSDNLKVSLSPEVNSDNTASKQVENTAGLVMEPAAQNVVVQTETGVDAKVVKENGIQKLSFKLSKLLAKFNSKKDSKNDNAKIEAKVENVASINSEEKKTENQQSQSNNTASKKNKKKKKKHR